jgi:hypothetical protein
VLEIEKYLYQQLTEPTDDIFKLLEGLSFLMGDSRYEAIQRRNYYDEMMRIPKIREILNIPEVREPEYKCPEPASRALVMMAATFGIALDRQIPAEPFHGLTYEEANSMWGRDEGEEEDRDTWEQLCWFIQNLSVTKRVEKAERTIAPVDQAQLRVLMKAEKNRKLSDNPTSLVTALPKRNRMGWDLNAENKRSKFETVDRALEIMDYPVEKLRINSKDNRNDQVHKGDRTRKALGDITRKAESTSNSTREELTIASRKKGVKRSSYEDGMKKQNLQPAKAKKVKKMHPEIHHSEKSARAEEKLRGR